MTTRNGKHLVGYIVTISNKDSWERRNWGVVRAFDGMHYHVAMNDNDNHVLIFERNEFVVTASQKP